MSYREIYQEAAEPVRERYMLCMERIAEIPQEAKALEGSLSDFFTKAAQLLLTAKNILERGADGSLFTRTLDKCRAENEALYAELSEAHYGESFANPDYAAEVLPETVAGPLCFLYSELYATIPFAFEERLFDVTIFAELLNEVYGLFRAAKDEGEALPCEALEETLRAFYHDYSEVFAEEEVRAKVDPRLDFFTKIVLESDLSEPTYLYRYGTYIGENEERLSAYLSTLPQEKIEAMARTYTEGYRIGFAVTGKDLSKKRYVLIEYPIGFERVVREAIAQFSEMGLTPVISREAVNSFTGLGKDPRGCYAKSLNRQYGFDHRNDKAYYLDKAFVERRLEALRTAFEQYKEYANLQAGPAVIETFGEADFSPVIKETAAKYTKQQNELNVRYASEAGRLTNEYIIGEERSFTIIAYPLPSIGERFSAIFDETVRINTLDYKRYQTMQQKLIDVLDTGERVRVVGRGANRTDITVSLYHLNDPAKETIFENCVADVNIPVGEVFTSPVLKGTTGLLHVTEVYLNGLKFIDLAITFEDGMIRDYTCANFEKEEDNRKYIYENVLMQHEALPIGEFAIGTNTTAYRMARDFDIAGKLPILIAEKTGPHFAVGDTCYSYEEDLVTYNPDGKAIVARDNEVSVLRKTDPEKAYLNCHTDITIPYDELSCITVLRADGTGADIIRDGLFVVPGTEELNEPLER